MLVQQKEEANALYSSSFLQTSQRNLMKGSSQSLRNIFSTLSRQPSLRNLVMEQGDCYSVKREKTAPRRRSREEDLTSQQKEETNVLYSSSFLQASQRNLMERSGQSLRNIFSTLSHQTSLRNLTMEKQGDYYSARHEKTAPPRRRSREEDLTSQQKEETSSPYSSSFLQTSQRNLLKGSNHSLRNIFSTLSRQPSLRNLVMEQGDCYSAKHEKAAPRRRSREEDLTSQQKEETNALYSSSFLQTSQRNLMERSSQSLRNIFSTLSHQPSLCNLTLEQQQGDDYPTRHERTSPRGGSREEDNSVTKSSTDHQDDIMKRERKTDHQKKSSNKRKTFAQQKEKKSASSSVFPKSNLMKRSSQSFRNLFSTLSYQPYLRNLSMEHRQGDDYPAKHEKKAPRRRSRDEDLQLAELIAEELENFDY
jgi:DUF1365 family protein